MGCLWHAAYAVTGDRRLLEYTDEVSNERFLVLLAIHGWLERTWWNQALLEQPCNWEALASTIPASSLHGTGYRRLYLCFRTGTLLHCAAMLFPFDPEQPHIISDSCSSTFFVMRNRRDFLETQYARAFMVSEFMAARLKLYPSRLVSRGPVFEMEES